MNKTEMAMKLAKKTGMSQGQAQEVLEVIFSAQPRTGLIATALDKGEKVTVPGFGAFSTKSRGERQGRNPQTREPMTIPASNVARFKAGKALKDAINA